MWDHLPVNNLLGMQRLAALKKMGQEAHELYMEGYAADADRVLDELNERRRRWEAEGT